MTKPDRREGGFNRIGRPQVAPVLGWEVVERQQHVAVSFQAVTGRSVLRTVLFQERIKCLVRIRLRFGLPDFVQVALRFGLNAPGHLV